MKPLEKILDDLVLTYDTVKDELEDYNSIFYQLWHFNSLPNIANARSSWRELLFTQ